MEEISYPDDPVTAFRKAVYFSDLDAIQRFHKSDPAIIDKIAQAELPDWIMCFAGKVSTPPAIRLLAELGADVNQQDSNGWTGLEFAVSYGRLDNAQAFLELGADPDLHCPIFETAQCERPENSIPLARLLLDYGADVNQPVIAEGMPIRNVLTEALATGNEELASFLRSRGAAPPGDLRQSGDRTLIDHAGVDFSAAVIKHIKRYYGNPASGAIREIVPTTDYPIAIHYVPGRRRAEWAYLFTTGLSSYEMNVPPGAEAYRRAELLLAIPRSWPAPDVALKDAQHAWPLQWLRKIAVYPLENGTWLGGEWSVIANGEPPEPLGPGTTFSAWGLASRDIEEMNIRVSTECQIRLHQMFPLYAEEYALERSEGFPALMSRIEKHGLPEGIDLTRINLANR